ncbi:MAG: AI-2E family transporter [Oscillospiraceae bacterium]
MQKKFSLFTHRMVANLITFCCAILFFILLYNFTAVRAEVAKYFSIVSPFFAAFIMAFLFNRPVMYFENKVFTKFKKRRLISVFVVLILAFVILGALLAVVIPQIGESLNMLWEKVPVFLKNVSDELPRIIKRFNLDPEITTQIFGSWEDIITGIATQIRLAIPQFLNVSVNIGSGIIKALMAIFACVYMLMSKEKLLEQIKKITYAFLPLKKAKRAVEIANQSNTVFADFIVGKLLDSTIIGLMCFIGMMLIYQPYALLISVIIGVTNVIPFFGPFIGAIPCIFILLIADPWVAIIFAVFVLALQQFDGNFLGPRILGDSTGLSPLWVLISITVGGGLFGFIGMLVGVPTFAVIYSLFSDFVANRLKAKNVTQFAGKVAVNVDKDPVPPPTKTDEDINETNDINKT